MKLHAASIHEIRRISMGTAVLDIIMIALLSFLSSFGIGTFDPLPIALAAAGGSIIAVINFTILCITIQNAVGIEDKQKMQKKFQLSYNIRMVIQAAWVLICYLSPYLHLFAGALPLFFPKVTILYLNATGKLIPKTAQPAQSEASGENSENAPASEEA